VESAYIRYESFAYDYGLVTLGKSIGTQTKYFGYASYTSKTLHARRFSSAGYPGDLSDGERMYVQSGKPLRATTREIVTHFDVGSGQSGSPLYILDGKKYYTAGILSSSSSEASYFTRLTSARLDRLDQWMDQDDQAAGGSSLASTAPSPLPAASGDRLAASRRAPQTAPDEADGPGLLGSFATRRLFDDWA
jgi:hypothetical protein